VNIVTTHSAYWILLILTLAGALIYFIYYKKLTTGASKYQSVFLSALRFLTFIFLGFLLLSPMIKINSSQVRKPVIIFAQDNSKSMILSKDSAFLQNTFPQKVQQIIKKLSEKYEVKTVQFGDTVKNNLDFTFNDKTTDFEEFFNKFNTEFFNINTGAVIIVSDGLYNKGTNPVYASQHLSFPVYTIPFGDTVPKADAKILKVNFNKTAYKGSNFPVVINVAATMLNGKNVTVELSKGDKLLKSKKITVEGNNFFDKIPFYIKADSSGVFEYSVKLSVDYKEINTFNNTKNIYINVEENKRKILLLQNGYHPDIAVFKRIIDKNPAFEIEILSPDKFTGKVQDYALVILHQLPSNKHSLQKILPELIKKEIPLLFIFGKETSVQAINNLNLFLKINRKNNLLDEVLPVLNNNFTLFNTTIDADALQGMPPLFVPFGEYKTLPANNVIMYQQIGSIKTQKPLWAFVDAGNTKIGFIVGEGIWRWRLYEYKKFRDHSLTNELITKTIQYLSLTKRKSPFVVEFPTISNENDNIAFKAQLFNASNEFVTNAEIKLKITDKNGNSYPYIFESSDNQYIANIGNLKKGKYRFTASTAVGNKKYKKSGNFIIKESMLEQSDLVADYNLLYKLSLQSNGKMFDKSDLDKLLTEIENNVNIKPVIYTQKTLKELIDLKWLFAIFILLLTIEWFFRKYWGMIQ